MTADIENLVLEHLRAIRAELTDLKREVAGNSVHLATLGQQVGALTTAFYTGKSEIEELKRRMDRVERRLDLSDAPTA
jgi:predicted  nucleic acid-binding Zn-ribbon protein